LFCNSLIGYNLECGSAIVGYKSYWFWDSLFGICKRPLSNEIQYI